jgi:hypothetical protein
MADCAIYHRVVPGGQGLSVPACQNHGTLPWRFENPSAESDKIVVVSICIVVVAAAAAAAAAAAVVVVVVVSICMDLKYY